MMTVVEVDKETFLSTAVHDPYPARTDPDDLPVDQRMLPVRYRCDQCDTEIAFSTSDFEKHYNSDFTNLSNEHRAAFSSFTGELLPDTWFLDFYCPKCNQPTEFVIWGGPSGYWGEFMFRIERVLVLKSSR
jgi:hypothetical protein